MIRYLLYIFVFWFFVFSNGCLVFNKDNEKVCEEMKGKLPCFFTSLDLNKILEEQGYGKNIISYTGAPYLRYVHESIIFYEKTEPEILYILTEDGRILSKPGPGNKIDFYVNASFKVIHTRPPEVGKNWIRRGEAIFDSNTQYIMYNYWKPIGPQNDYRPELCKFVIVDIETDKVVVEQIGSGYSINVKEDNVYFDTGEMNSGFYYNSMYRLNLSDRKKVEIKIPQSPPEELPNSMVFVSEDIDLENGNIAYSAYTDSGRFFFMKSLRTKVWLYNIKKQEFFYRWIPGKTEGGHVQVLFLPDSLKKVLNCYN